MAKLDAEQVFVRQHLPFLAELIRDFRITPVGSDANLTMLTSIFIAIAQNVLSGWLWLWRGLQDLVAFTAGLGPLFLMLH